jgi:hypothetical protein
VSRREAQEGPRGLKSPAESISLAEIEWFHTRCSGAIPEEAAATAEERAAATAIAGWLGQLATFHAGALSLRFTPRYWPESLWEEFGPWTSLIVRLECATHPSERRTHTSALEVAAVLRLEEMLADQHQFGPKLIRLDRHAFQHVRAAVRAYVRVRGRGPSVLPSRVCKELP